MVKRRALTPDVQQLPRLLQGARETTYPNTRQSGTCAITSEDCGPDQIFASDSWYTNGSTEQAASCDKDPPAREASFMVS